MSDAWKDRERGMENEFFHRREQEVMQKMRDKLAAENAESSRMDCPRGDGGKLIETDFEDVKIDVCEKCSGVWLDAGELGRLVHKQEDTWVSRLFGHYPESK